MRGVLLDVMPWEFLKCPCFILLRIYCSTLKCFLLFLQETKNFRTVYSWWYIVHWLNHPLIFIHAKYIAVKNLCSIWIIQKIVPPPPTPAAHRVSHLSPFLLCSLRYSNFELHLMLDDSFLQLHIWKPVNLFLQIIQHNCASGLFNGLKH